MNFFITYKDTIIPSVVVLGISGFFGYFFKLVINYIKKGIAKKILQKPAERAVYLNNPQKVFNDKCLGRDRLLKKVFVNVTGEESHVFVGNHIAIVGQEGIGKTLFCQTLFFREFLSSKIYMGWIECNGSQSVFDIIKRTFNDFNIMKKNRNDLLKMFKELKNPCVLFIDQVNQYTPMEEIIELSNCQNVTLIISGLLKKIPFIEKQRHFELKKLPKEIIRKIFEQKSGEEIDFMEYDDANAVKSLISNYVRGNPFLAVSLVSAKSHNNNSWITVLENVNKNIYEDGDDYVKDVLRQLYGIDQLLRADKSILSKLAVFFSGQYVTEVFEWCDIPTYSVTYLCKTYWLEQETSILYKMEETRKEIIHKTLGFTRNLENTILAVTEYLESWAFFEDKGFRWIAPYMEDIMIIINGYAPHIIKEKSNLFLRFTYIVAVKYLFAIMDFKKSLGWLDYCNPTNEDLLIGYGKAMLEFRSKVMLKSHFTVPEVEQAYVLARNKAVLLKDYSDYEVIEKSLSVAYCMFLVLYERYSEAKSKCKEYFEKFGSILNDFSNCLMFSWNLFALIFSGDDDALDSLINNDLIASLSSIKNEENEFFYISIGDVFGALATIYEDRGDSELADKCTRHLVILFNKHIGFFHKSIGTFLCISDEDFAEYMHSHIELKGSLQEAIDREDPEALYIEGRYKEKQGKNKEAFALYEKAAKHDSLRGICSLALMYYYGKGEKQNFDKARKYWDYCCERNHRGSYYWLGILFLNERYDDHNVELAVEYLTKAVLMGSEHAKEKLLELGHIEKDDSCEELIKKD